MIDHQAKNKMSLNNVSVIMAPNIFMFKGFRTKVTEQQEYSMAAGTANIVRLLIRYQNLLWTVRILRASLDAHHRCKKNPVKVVFLIKVLHNFSVYLTFQVSVCFPCVQIPKFIVTQVRQQNAENQRKQNKERAVRKLLKKITIEKSSEKPLQEVT